jgi:hypothetical protein
MRSRKRTQGIHIGKRRERERRERETGRGGASGVKPVGPIGCGGGEQRESRWQRKNVMLCYADRTPLPTFGFCYCLYETTALVVVVRSSRVHGVQCAYV